MDSERVDETPAGTGAAKRLQNFLTSITGVISSLVLLIGAAGTLYATVLNPVGGSPPPSPSPTPPPPTAQPPPPPPVPPPATPPTAPPGPSLADWRREANELCAESNRQLRATFGRPPQVYEELVAYYQGALPVVSRVLLDLRALESPPARADDVADFLAALEAQNDNAAEAVAAWQAGNSPLFQRAVGEVERAGATAVDAASELGARECALGPFG